MKDANPKIYQFGCFRLNASEGVLLRRGRPVRLPPKTLDTLMALVENSGHLVTKAELMNRVWPDTHVEEMNLARHVSGLRKVLGRGPSSRPYIETVARRGYRFNARVSQIEGVAKQAAPPFTSLAVLPFQNQTSDPALDYLCTGIAEGIINALVQLPHLHVTGRNTTFSYSGRDANLRELGRQLDVQCLLTGRIVKVNDRLVIGAELVDARTGHQLWGEQYNRTTSGTFRVQADIVHAISAALKLRLTKGQTALLARPHTGDIEAYHLYLRGRHFYDQWNPAALLNAIQCFERAIAVDPTYALAYAALADSCAMVSWLAFYLAPPTAARPKVEAATIKALEYGDWLPEAHLARAGFLLLYEWNFDEAEREYLTAIAQAPRNGSAYDYYALYLTLMGRFLDADRALEKALSLDPLSPRGNLNAALNSYCARRFDEAAARYQRILSFDPHFVISHWGLGTVYEAQGAYELAIEPVRQALTMAEQHTAIIATLGYVYARAGRPDEAQRVLTELQAMAPQRYVAPGALALIAMGLGDLDRAFDWLEEGFEQRDTFLLALNTFPIVDSARSDQRFNDLLARIGFLV